MSDETLSIIGMLLDVLITFMIVKLAFNWLVRFDVLNEKHPSVAKIKATIAAIFEPLYRQIRKVVPEIWGIDPSPFVVIILLIGLRQGLRYFFG